MLHANFGNCESERALGKLMGELSLVIRSICARARATIANLGAISLAEKRVVSFCSASSPLNSVGEHPETARFGGSRRQLSVSPSMRRSPVARLKERDYQARMAAAEMRAAEMRAAEMRAAAAVASASAPAVATAAVPTRCARVCAATTRAFSLALTKRRARSDSCFYRSRFASSEQNERLVPDVTSISRALNYPTASIDDQVGYFAASYARLFLRSLAHAIQL